MCRVYIVGVRLREAELYTSIMHYIRKELETQRRDKGLTQREQASRIGWSENELSRWLRGSRPSLGKIEEVAPLLGHDLPSLISEVYKDLVA